MYVDVARLDRNLRKLQQLPNGDHDLENLLVAWHQQYGREPNEVETAACIEYVVNCSNPVRMAVGKVMAACWAVALFMHVCSTFANAG